MDRTSSPASSSGTRRTRNVVTIEKKLEIIDKLKKGASATALSNQYGIPRQTISDWNKNADEIQKFASQMESIAGRPKKTQNYAKSIQRSC